MTQQPEIADAAVRGNALASTYALADSGVAIPIGIPESWPSARVHAIRSDRARREFFSTA